MSYIKFKTPFSNKGKGKEIGRAISGPILQYLKLRREGESEVWWGISS
jgi:hypothetical protein